MIQEKCSPTKTIRVVLVRFSRCVISILINCPSSRTAGFFDHRHYCESRREDNVRIWLANVYQNRRGSSQSPQTETDCSSRCPDIKAKGLGPSSSDLKHGREDIPREKHQVACRPRWEHLIRRVDGEQGRKWLASFMHVLPRARNRRNPHMSALSLNMFILHESVVIFKPKELITLTSSCLMSRT